MRTNSSPQTILFIGDSITDCGRRQQHAPLGNGYVALVDDMLKLHQPSADFRVVNRGIAGNTIEDLRSRWTDHVLCEAPDYLVIKIGINDCNRYQTDPSKELQSPQQYAKIYDQILTQTRKSLPNTKVLILSPFFISKDSNIPDAYRARVRADLKEYITHAEKAAKTHGAHYFDLQAKFEQLLEHMRPCELADDGVHPNRTGTLFIAQEVFGALCKVQGNEISSNKTSPVSSLNE
ncbi:SGNH/GDSL hydrolase family protein [Coraliomargarita sp. SDUM461003]|uniref:SGNH/GDSL hydrolase family protein n=1 Tax=Thalassobacterium maritimum TaxID=3041265 RepID=A0ABU1AZ86_9BACT|nr:SGNH/GDSL hydrolase family protein [Coraliomargarita sp. SDUM461003]MDQ8209391.1 SGNH/GDSL hydrolase family protein [Coraliomargarita sp. SDUM461003]